MHVSNLVIQFVRQSIRHLSTHEQFWRKVSEPVCALPGSPVSQRGYGGFPSCATANPQGVENWRPPEETGIPEALRTSGVPSFHSAGLLAIEKLKCKQH